MKTSHRRLKPVRLASALLIVMLVCGAGVAAATWVSGMQKVGSPVAISESTIATPDGDVTVMWPSHGAAAFAVGDGTIYANSEHALPMASISKVITTLMILEQRPLNPGEQGESFWFSHEDEAAYYDALSQEKSALPVPVGGALTEYQLLQGILLGSACNYVDYLVANIWGSNHAFVDAAADFLDRHGLEGITMVEPTGIDPRNTATPAALIAVGKLAMTHPVVAEIVSQQWAALPGVGDVENTNDLLADPGVVGLKTGTLDGYSLLSAKDVTTADGSSVRAFVVVMSQPSDEERFSTSRDLYVQIAQLIS